MPEIISVYSVQRRAALPVEAGVMSQHHRLTNYIYPARVHPAASFSFCCRSSLYHSLAFSISLSYSHSLLSPRAPPTPPSLDSFLFHDGVPLLPPTTSILSLSSVPYDPSFFVTDKNSRYTKSALSKLAYSTFWAPGIIHEPAEKPARDESRWY